MNSLSKARLPLLLLLLAAFLVGIQVSPRGEAAQSAAAPGSDAPTFMAGTWTGLGSQVGASFWSIALVAHPQKGHYSIAYPSLSCGGVWELESFDETRAWFREHIEYGEDYCYDNSRIAVTAIDHQYLTLSWFHPDDTLIAWSTIKKKSEADK